MTIAAEIPTPAAAPPEPLVDSGAVAEAPLATDRQLLTRFASSRDEGAFGQLVARHGPLVLAVCRRVLRRSPDVDDAFQATFLALAQRAGQVAWQESAAGWLHRVAFRAACRLRADNARKREVAWSEPSLVAAEFPDRERASELDEIAAVSAEQVLHEEVLRLPGVYRDAIVLCCLEGMSREAAARELGTSETVLKGRLQRGRKMLVLQCGLRGVALSIVLTAFQASLAQAAPAVPPALAASTAAAAGQFAAGNLAQLSPRSITLARGVPQMISQATLASKASWCVAALAALGLATALVVGNAAAGDGRGPGVATVPLLPANSAGGLGAEFQLAQAPELAKAPDAGQAPQSLPARAKEAGAAASEARIMVALQNQARLEFIETPLADVVEFLKDEHEIPFHINKKALEDAGVDTNTPITANLAGISLRSALRQVLGGQDLCYVIRDEVLLVTTKKEAAQYFIPRIYQVNDLLPAKREGELAKLADLIKAAVGPNTWREATAESAAGSQTASPARLGTITPHAEELLVISQSWPVHEQIELFLADLRKHQQLKRF